MKPAILFTLVFASLFMVSCGQSGLLFVDVDKLERGMSKRAVDSLLPVDASYLHQLKENRSHFEAEFYSFLVTKESSSSTTSFGMTQSHVEVSTVLVLLYEEGRLQYWGFGADYKKCEDERIAALGPKIAQMARSNR